MRCRVSLDTVYSKVTESDWKLIIEVVPTRIDKAFLM